MTAAPSGRAGRSVPPAGPKPPVVLYRDRRLIAVSKPSGMLVHRSAEARDRRFLLQRASAGLGVHLYPVHRIDRAASGIVLFAADPASAARLQRLLRAATTTKEYLVLARGHVAAPFSSVRALIGPQRVRRQARTTFWPLSHHEGATLLRVRLHTGRRHQIRRHLNHAGHHVVGDTTHGKGHVNRTFRERHGLHRMFLHHTRLSLGEGWPGGPLVIEDPLPGELRWVLHSLRGAAGAPVVPGVPAPA